MSVSSQPNLKSVGHQDSSDFDYPYKTYSSGKAYSSSTSSADAIWWQQATVALMNHYSDLKKGVDPEQSQHILRPEDLQQLMQWMQMFATPRGISFDPTNPMGSIGTVGLDGNPISSQLSQEPNEFGGKWGTEGWYYDDSDETTIGFVQGRNDISAHINTLNIKNPSGVVTAEITSDYGVKVLKVIVKTKDGTAAYYYDGIDSATFDLTLNVVNVDKLTEQLKNLPPEIQAKIHVNKYDPKAAPQESNDEAKPTLEKPDETNGNQRTWLGTPGHEGLSYIVSEGTEEDVTYRPALDVVLPDSRWSVEVVKTGADQYEFTFYNAEGKKVRSLKSFQTQSINFPKPAYAGNVRYKNIHDPQGIPVTKDPVKNDGIMRFPASVLAGLINPGANTPVVKKEEPPVAWNKFTRSPDEHVHVEGFEFSQKGKTGGTPHAGDTPPDDLSPDGTEATFNSAANVTLHADFDSPITTFNIQGPTTGKVTIHATNYSDEVFIDKVGANRYTVRIRNKDGKEVTCKIDGQHPEIKGTAKAKYRDGDMNGDGKVDDADYVDFGGMDPNVTVEGSGKMPKTIQNLINLTGKSSKEVLAQFKIYFGINSVAELDNAIKQKAFPPSAPTTDLIKFLFSIDPQFQKNIEMVDGANDDTKRASVPFMKEASLRLVELLKNLYNEDPANPDIDVSLTNPTSNNLWDLNDINFNGQNINYTAQDGNNGFNGRLFDDTDGNGKKENGKDAWNGDYRNVLEVS